MKLEQNELTEKQALEQCFEMVKPKLMDEKSYQKFKQYRLRYKNGTLGSNAKETVLEFFDYRLIGKIYKRK